MSDRVGMPSSLTGATLSRSGEGVTLNPSTVAAPRLTPQATPSLPSSLGSPPPAGGISMANLFGNPALSATPPPMTPSPMASTMPSLSPAIFTPPPNPLASPMSQLATPKTPLVTATPAQATFTPQPLPSLGQPTQPLILANQSSSPRSAVSGKRNAKSGRRQVAEINPPAVAEIDMVANVDDRPKKGWGYIFSPLNIIFLILVFIIVFMTLYGSKLNMVTDLQDGTRVLNNKKLILWTVVVTIIITLVAFIVMSAVAKRRRG